MNTRWNSMKLWSSQEVPTLKSALQCCNLLVKSIKLPLHSYSNSCHEYSENMWLHSITSNAIIRIYKWINWEVICGNHSWEWKFTKFSIEISTGSKLINFIPQQRTQSVSTQRTNCLTLRWLMSYIYAAPILDVSRSHTTTQHSR